MNIFLIDKRPHECAKALCDLRLNKMILETAQLLCTSHRYHFPDRVEQFSDVIYKVTHENHPCSIWMRKHINNHSWMLTYFEHLFMEKQYRTGKNHLSFVKLEQMLYDVKLGDPIGTLDYDSMNFDFNCSGIYPSTNNVFADYKLCLLQKWIVDKREPKFSARSQPDFITFDLAKAREVYLEHNSEFSRGLYKRHMLTSDPIWRQHAQAA
jgi:hypothetical protein